MSRLAAKLAARSGEKTSSLEGLGRIKAASHKVRGARHKERRDRSREDNAREQNARKAEREQRERDRQSQHQGGIAEILAGRALGAASLVDRFLRGTIERDRGRVAPAPDRADAPEPVHRREPQPQHDRRGHDGGHDR